ncbi:MAG: RsmG family class I SAM-dependent methyltransferase [Acidobacteriota bacterium]|nr:RsmG family class I SAM-dependent methyltransferase [Acidobacteriota bacterium]
MLAERSDACAEALWRHYQELRRWNRRTSLVGPGTAGEAWSRHYGEALAAVPLLVDALSAFPSAPRPNLVDLGSGAGFPGFVLAAALPELDVTLVDARERKWAFLRHAARRAGVHCHCLQLRVDLPLPEELPAQIHVLTLRALKLSPEVMAQLAHRMPRGARLLSWQSGTEPLIPPPPPAGRKASESEPRGPEPTPRFRPGRVIPLPGSERRFVVESVREA